MTIPPKALERLRKLYGMTRSPYQSEVDMANRLINQSLAKYGKTRADLVSLLECPAGVSISKNPTEAELAAGMAASAAEYHRRKRRVFVDMPDADDDDYVSPDALRMRARRAAAKAPPPPPVERERKRAEQAAKKNAAIAARSARQMERDRESERRAAARTERDRQRRKLKTPDDVRAELCGYGPDELSEAISYREQVARGER